MQRKFSHAFHVPGTLAASLNIRFTVPSGCTLVHVSAVASNDSDATLALGTSSDTDGWHTAAVIGDSATPVEWDSGDFDGALVTNKYPVAADGDIVVAILDYDGASGTAADDFTLVLTFVEGGV